jgi:hypothetical protein
VLGVLLLYWRAATAFKLASIVCLCMLLLLLAAVAAGT